MKRLCVFCGSNPGHHPEFAAAVRALGETLARRRIGVVYGAGNVGLMGELANAVLRASGEIIGVIPYALVRRELAHTGLADLRVVTSMHERKALMAKLSDGFVALPGGLGTFEELLEIVTWSQLGLHAKPCGILNVRGFFDGLLGFLDHAVEEGFLKPLHRRLLVVANDPEELVDRFERYTPPAVEKWITPDQA